MHQLIWYESGPHLLQQVENLELLLKKYFSMTQSRTNNHHHSDVDQKEDKVNGKTQAISYGAIMVLGEDSVPAGNDQPVDFSIADEQTDLNSSSSSEDDTSDLQVKKRGRRISRRTRKRPAKFRDYERSDSETSVTESEAEVEEPKQEVVIVPDKPKKKKPKVSPKKHVLLPPQVVHKLKQWMLDHVDHPYPNDSEKNQLVQETGLTLRQLNDWFSNARRRWFLKGSSLVYKS